MSNREFINGPLDIWTFKDIEYFVPEIAELHNGRRDTKIPPNKTFSKIKIFYYNIENFKRSMGK